MKFRENSSRYEARSFFASIESLVCEEGLILCYLESSVIAVIHSFYIGTVCFDYNLPREICN